MALPACIPTVSDYYEDLSSKTRDMNKLLQAQLNKIYDEMMKYKVRKSTFSRPLHCVETKASLYSSW